MIDNGCGIITIAQENQPIFFEKLIKYYETNNNTRTTLKAFNKKGTFFIIHLKKKK